ncbi:hypothetical protein TNCV_1544711 [Trichonephila clavipes]|nr:hypothetical protein TNCV_1544711 [Trichonephila clavipes]
MFETLWGGQLQHATPSENHPENDSIVAERVGPIAVQELKNWPILSMASRIETCIAYKKNMPKLRREKETIITKMGKNSAFVAWDYSKQPSSHTRKFGGRGSEVGGAPETQGVLSQNWGVTEPNRTVTYIVLKATDNDRRAGSLLPR